MALKLVILAALVAVALASKPYQGFALPKLQATEFLDGRIVGGSDAKPGQFPYQVSLQWGIFNMQHFCAGSILNSQWVITAAHCIKAIPNYGNFVVKAGKYNLKKTEGNEQIIKVAKSFVHEKYPGNVAPYDIGLLKLEKPLQLNGAVKAIPLPAPGSIPQGMAVLSGWGSISPTAKAVMPDILQTAKLPLIDIPTCKAAIEKLTGPSPLADTNVCTGPLTGGQSACNGDSGGPLVLNTNGRTELIGIVSWGIVPCGTVGAPSVYTRTSAYNSWIQNIVAKN